MKPQLIKRSLTTPADIDAFFFPRFFITVDFCLNLAYFRLVLIALLIYWGLIHWHIDEEETKHINFQYLYVTQGLVSYPLARKLAHLSLCQVLIRSHEEGGEEGLRRPEVGKEAEHAEQQSRVQHRRVAGHVGHTRRLLRGTQIYWITKMVHSNQHRYYEMVWTSGSLSVWLDLARNCLIATSPLT